VSRHHDLAGELDLRGFAVVHDAVPADDVPRLAAAYDAAVASALPADIKVGTASTRVVDFVNRGEVFDALYVCAPLLDACRQVIGPAFKLSSFHARTLHPRVPAEDLHVDVRRHSRDWPLVSFIYMIDAFTADNGATRFVPASHLWPQGPEDAGADRTADREHAVQACGAAGSLIVFNGSTWHEHSANTTDHPRRSIQGAFTPRGGKASTDFGGRMSSDTKARLSPVARELLGV
jgi:hypothetical protein